MRLGGKVAIITGSSRGIGAAIARGYAEEGCRVALTVVQKEAKARELAAEIGAQVVCRLDVRDRDQLRCAHEQTIAT